MKCKRMAAVLLAFLLFAGCGQQEGGSGTAQQDSGETQQSEVVDYGGTLNLYAYAPDTLNPLITDYQCNVEMLGLIYEGLFCVEQDFTATPVLASGYEASDGNSRYTVYLKDHVRFHDGSTFGAADVVATIDNMIAYQSSFADRLDNVARYYASGNAVVFELKRPQSNFVCLLDFPILPRSVPSGGFAKESSAFVPVGTGKYKYDHETEYKQLMLVWNTDWHGGTPSQVDHYIDQIRVVYIKNPETGVYSFDAGELDLLTTSIYTWGNYSLTRTVQTLESTNNMYSFIGVNHRNFILADPAVRKAMELAVDKSRLASDIMYSHAAPANAPVNPNAYYFDAQSQTPVYDTEAAKAALAQAGWLDLNSDGILEKVFDGTEQALSFELLYNEDNALRQVTGEFLKNALLEIGVELRLTAVDFASYQARIQSGEYDLFLGKIDIHNDGALDFLLRSDGEQNSFGFSAADAALDAVAAADSHEEIIAAYQHLQAVLAEQTPIIGLFYGTSAVLQGTRVKGDLHASRTGPFTGMDQLFINYKE